MPFQKSRCGGGTATTLSRQHMQIGAMVVPRGMLATMSSQMLACTPKARCVCAAPQDQTGIMGAAIHSSALQQQPQLGPGCVLLLQSVSVLTPNPGSCYLAVTADNIAKVRWATTTARTARLDAGPGCRLTHHTHSCSAGGTAPLLPHAAGIHTHKGTQACSCLAMSRLP